MSKAQLYMAPGTCARVSSICLEEVGLDFETVAVRFLTGEHKAPAYKKLNPLGKVPALVIDGEVLTENVAIIIYLNEVFAGANLMPHASSSLARAHQLADLCFCSATLHPIVTRIRMPQFFANEEAVQSVWEKACHAMMKFFNHINDRLTSRPWWYGDQWSAIDAYLYWIFWRVEGADFDVAKYPHFKDHFDRMELRPSVQCAWERERRVQAELEDEGLNFSPAKRP